MACDQYHLYAQDMALAEALNQKSYRFSISWPRIQPAGTGRRIMKGIDHYSRFVDAMLEAGIRPFCTIYHWDLPQGARRLEAGRIATWPDITPTMRVFWRNILEIALRCGRLSTCLGRYLHGIWRGSLSTVPRQLRDFLKAAHTLRLRRPRRFARSRRLSEGHGGQCVRHVSGVSEDGLARRIKLRLRAITR